MIVVVSETWPDPERKQDYLALVAELQPALHAIDGFISSERFESCSEPGKYVSVSRWRDEQALGRWRNLEEHRIVMAKGRSGILKDYRIQVTSLLWDYSMTSRADAPEDSKVYFSKELR